MRSLAREKATVKQLKNYADLIAQSKKKSSCIELSSVTVLVRECTKECQKCGTAELDRDPSLLLKRQFLRVIYACTEKLEKTLYVRSINGKRETGKLTRSINY